MTNELFKRIARHAFKKSLVGNLYKNSHDPLSEVIRRDPVNHMQEITPTEGSVLNKSYLLEAIANRCSTRQSGNIQSSNELLKEVTFEGKVGLVDVLYSLRTYGVAIFPALYNGERLKRLQNEYKLFMSDKQKCVYNTTVGNVDAGNSVALDFKRSKLNRRLFPEMAKLFGSETLFTVCSEYFSGQDFEFNGDMFIQSTGSTSKPLSGELHWDKQLTLKSWVYVSEATEGYGAMRASLGNASWTRYAREDAIFDGRKYNQISNEVEVDEASIVSTGGPAGTFFIFVSDTPHGATHVTEGNVREIIRSEARPTRIKEWANWSSN